MHIIVFRCEVGFGSADFSLFALPGTQKSKPHRLKPVLLSAPGRAFRPVAHGLGCPGGGFIRVARRAWIRDFVFVRHRRRDKCKRVGAHEDTGNRDLDFRHVAGHAFAARGAVFVMRMLGKRRRAGPISSAGAVTIEA